MTRATSHPRQDPELAGRAARARLRERVARQSRRLGRAVRRHGLAWTVRRAARVLRPGSDAFLRSAAPARFRERYVPEDHSVVTLYTDDPALFPGHRPRRPLPPAAGHPPLGVTLVATMRDEREQVERWVHDVLAQTRPPDEVVVVDGGSRDGSLAALRAVTAGSAVPFRLIDAGASPIARGRNLAIDAARHPVIAVTDLGVRLPPRWLERITAPFAADPATEVIAGFYVARGPHGRVLHRRLWPTLRQVRPATFLPSSRSIAFRRSAWEAARGYPEWLTLTGEDTYFACELKRYCRNWAFVPEAVVEWSGPSDLRSYWRKAYAWSVGDGESGLFAGSYWRALLVATLGATVTAVPVSLAVGGLVARRRGLLRAAGVSGGLTIAAAAATALRAGVPLRDLGSEYGAQVQRVRGFLHGARQREPLTRRREALHRGVLLVLAGVPIDDTGGGARCTQITLELLRQGWKVVYAHRFPKYESRELGLRIAHPDLDTCEWARFDPEALLAIHHRLGGDIPVAVLVEFPLPEFLPAIRRLEAAGVTVAYDLVDEWDSELGSTWYSEAAERELARTADILTGTTPALVERLEGLSGAPATLLPNAVNLRLFDADRPYDPPEDLPEGAWRIIYVGALWGDWFDWELLLAVGRRYPDAAVTVIGDYIGQCPGPPPNLHFLGLKAQRDLPAYLAHADVAILPWKVNQVTEATSPLKLYEYLAMRLPVVAPDLPPLRGVPFALLSRDREQFLTDVGRARQQQVRGQELEPFLAANSWQARVEQLAGMIGKAHGR